MVFEIELYLLLQHESGNAALNRELATRTMKIRVHVVQFGNKIRSSGKFPKWILLKPWLLDSH